MIAGVFKETSERQTLFCSNSVVCFLFFELNQMSGQKSFLVGVESV